MRIWRISRFPSLDGQGGMLASNRWHDAPRPIIYCADHPSTALIEVLVHLEVEFKDIPNDYQLLEIEIPDVSGVQIINPAELIADWPNSEDFSRFLGNSWFDEKRHLGMSVPSVILPAARLYLLNAAHPEFTQIRTISTVPVSFDRRLWKTN